MIHDKKTKEITLIEVGITNKDIIDKIELTKAHKYEILANELKYTHPEATVTIVPIVLTWDGLVTKHFKRYMKKFKVNNRLQAYIQTVGLRRTWESILIDCREGLRAEWLERRPT